MKEIFHILKTYFINFQYVNNKNYNNLTNIIIIFIIFFVFFNLNLLITNFIFY